MNLFKDDFLPIGSNLMILLNSNHISYGLLDKILKSKGIFIGQNEKEHVVPILSSTILTGKDFNELMEASINRESKEKIKISNLELCKNDIDWVSTVKDKLFNEDFDPSKKIDGVQFIVSPDVVVENNNKVRIPYKIKREDFSNDWLKRQLEFDGEIVIEQQDKELKLDFLKTHSSIETEKINEKITTQLAKVLKNENIVTTDQIKIISFDSFSNQERVRFFKRLTGGVENILILESVHDIEIMRTDKEIPDDDLKISWMKDTVKGLKVDGERLHEIFLISEEEYYQYYEIRKIIISYNYIIGPNKGQSKVNFYFSHLSRSNTSTGNSELVFDIVKITHENKINTQSEKNIEREIKKLIKQLIESKYEEIVVNKL